MYLWIRSLNNVTPIRNLISTEIVMNGRIKSLKSFNLSVVYTKFAEKFSAYRKWHEIISANFAEKMLDYLHMRKEVEDRKEQCREDLFPKNF